MTKKSAAREKKVIKDVRCSSKMLIIGRVVDALKVTSIEMLGKVMIAHTKEHST